MLLLSGKKDKDKRPKKKRPLSPGPVPVSAVAALPPRAPSPQQPHQQQQQQPHEHRGARVDGPGGGGKRRKKGGAGREEDALITPWTVVPVAERDILVDRVRKEVAPLLGNPPTAVSASGDDDSDGEAEEDEQEGQEGDGRQGGRRRRRRRRRSKGRAKAFSARDGTPAQRVARAHLAVGLNEVMRALEKQQTQPKPKGPAGGGGNDDDDENDDDKKSSPSPVALLLLCRDVKPARVLEPAAALALLRGTPFFVLPKASLALGRALGLRRTAALGIRRPVEGAGQGGEGGEEGQEEEVRATKQKLASFLDFVLAKREFMSNAPPPLEGLREE